MKLLGDLGTNPVQAHITLRFKPVANKEQQLTALLDDLREQKFDHRLSRVLVFVRTRKHAEEVTEQLKTQAEELGLEWAKQVDFFHAGLDGTDRAEKYEAYKPVRKAAAVAGGGEDAKTAVLVATKAFGMGMDIGNIHYLYHLGPSSTFEDFLQEVGRAGRDAGMRQKANFGEGRPIRAMCVATREDFGKLRDLQHRSDLTWDYLGQVQQLVHKYIERFRPLEPRPTEAFPLPLDLAEEMSEDDAGGGETTKFRLGLHWLEQLGRIRLGLYTPAHLPIQLCDKPNYGKIKDQTERQEVEQFVIRLRASPYCEGPSLLLPMAELMTLSGKRRWAELYRLLFRAQKAGAICIERYLPLELTDLRRAELTAWREEHGCAPGKLPLVEAAFGLAQHLMARVRPGEQLTIDGDELDRMVASEATEHFQSRQIYWEEVDRNKRKLTATATRQKLIKDWHKKRAKFGLKLIRLLPRTRVESVLNRHDRSQARVVQLIYNGNQDAKQWKQPLAELKRQLTKLLAYVVETGQTRFNYADLVVELGLENAAHDYLDNLLFLARALGYLKGSGSLVPMGIELFLDDLATPNKDDRASADYQKYLDFEEGIRLKELRLMALQCLANLKSAERQDTFIKRYFQCESGEFLLKLLEEYLPENHPSLAAFQKEALVKAEKGLSEEQRIVYDAPLTDNLQVIAGPGSGKTHTLTLRVARLVQKAKVPPEQILVLAYNRAVVVELKDRLSKLFRALGYGRLIQRLHIHTFHSLCRRCMGAALDGKEFDEWTPAFVQALERDPGLLSRELGRIRYVFVDEFQDITELRLRLLKLLAPNTGPEGVRLCVIGDPNQSIYGYERIKEGGAIDPHPYYVQFHRQYEPQTLFLSNNYRSYPGILQAAARVLATNEVRFKRMPQLQAVRLPSHERPYCQLLRYRDSKTDWRIKLNELLGEEYEPGKPYQQVAVMLRSNDEVFRVFNELRSSTLPPDVSLRIQGASMAPVATREFYHLLHSFRAEPAAPLSATYLDEFNTRKQAALRKFEHVWDPYLMHLLHCLLYEFNKERPEEGTNQDVLDFVEEMARRDDGHFAKLYDSHIETVASGQRRREVVLTTMHKVKGLEFDAVLLPPGFTDFGLDKRTGEAAANLTELVEEERRLLYVAYTRARYRLVVINYDREEAVATGKPYALEGAEQKLGRILKPGLDKLFISWGGSNPNAYEFIQGRVKIGDPITLTRDAYGRWLIHCHGTLVGRLRGGQFKPEPQAARLEGLAVAGVVCYTHEESLRYDTAHNSTFTTDNWQSPAVKRGHIYLVDFAGYYKAD